MRDQFSGELSNAQIIMTGQRSKAKQEGRKEVTTFLPESEPPDRMVWSRDWRASADDEDLGKMVLPDAR
jgi:hypothetical protein